MSPLKPKRHPSPPQPAKVLHLMYDLKIVMEKDYPAYGKGCECRPKSVRHSENTASPERTYAFHPGVLPVPDWSPLLPAQVRWPAPQLSLGVPRLGIAGERRAIERGEFWEVQLTRQARPQRGIRQQFCTHSRVKWVERKKRWDTSGARKFLSPANFVLNIPSSVAIFELCQITSCLAFS